MSLQFFKLASSALAFLIISIVTASSATLTTLDDEYSISIFSAGSWRYYPKENKVKYFFYGFRSREDFCCSIVTDEGSPIGMRGGFDFSSNLGSLTVYDSSGPVSEFSIKIRRTYTYGDVAGTIAETAPLISHMLDSAPGDYWAHPSGHVIKAFNVSGDGILPNEFTVTSHIWGWTWIDLDRQGAEGCSMPIGTGNCYLSVGIDAHLTSVPIPATFPIILSGYIMLISVRSLQRIVAC